MIKKSFLLFSFLYIMGCGSTIKTSSESRNVLAKHKTVAIIPFEISLGPKLQKIDKFTEPEREELRRYMSIILQQHLYGLLKQKQKRFPLYVTVQSTELTNNLLSAKKISFADVLSNNKKEICRILGVDAIISTQTIFGKLERTDFNDVLNHGSLESDFAIYDSVNTEKLWQYNKTISDNLFKGLAKGYNADPLPETQYRAEDKYQKVLIPWIPSIDRMFQNFTADMPYKRK